MAYEEVFDLSPAEKLKVYIKQLYSLNNVRVAHDVLENHQTTGSTELYLDRLRIDMTSFSIYDIRIIIGGATTYEPSSSLFKLIVPLFNTMPEQLNA